MFRHNRFFPSIVCPVSLSPVPVCRLSHGNLCSDTSAEPSSYSAADNLLPFWKASSADTQKENPSPGPPASSLFHSYNIPERCCLYIFLSYSFCRANPVNHHFCHIFFRHLHPDQSSWFKAVIDPVFKMMRVASLMMQPASGTFFQFFFSVDRTTDSLIVDYSGSNLTGLYLERSWQMPCQYNPTLKQVLVTNIL